MQQQQGRRKGGVHRDSVCAYRKEREKGGCWGRVNRNAQRRRLSTQPSSKETKRGGWKKEKRASLLLSTSLSLFFPNASTVALLEKKIARLLCAEKGRGWGGGARKEDCCFLLLSDCWTESMMMLPSPPSLPSPPPSAQIRRVYVYFLPLLPSPPCMLHIFVSRADCASFARRSMYRHIIGQGGRKMQKCPPNFSDFLGCTFHSFIFS